jgi:PAS domain S-box-containing protein
MSDPSAPGPPFDEQAFRRLAEVAADAMFVHARGTILWANEAAAKLLGVASAAQLVGTSALGLCAPEGRAVIDGRLSSLPETGQPFQLFEELFHRPDGSKAWIEASGTTIGEGLVLVVARDVSERRLSERQGRDAAARARAFFDAQSEALGISRLGLHIEVNAAYAALFGYAAPAELVGVPVLDLIDPSEHERIAGQIQRRAEGGPVPSTYSVLARRRTGERFLMDVHGATYFDGEAHTTIVVLRDVTAQRTAAARLEDSERRYRELFEQVPVGVWEADFSGVRAIVDELGGRGVTDLRAHFALHPEDLFACARAVKLLAVNSAACRLLGARDQAELLANLHQVIIPDSLETLVEEIALLAEGRLLLTTEGWVTTISGDRRWVTVQMEVPATQAHDWSRVMVSTTDLTAQRQALQERDALQDRLRHAERLEAVGRLAGGIAHDFNNLLAVIMTNTEVGLIDAQRGTFSAEPLDAIRVASLRARDLVRQILTFGRKDSPRPEPLDLARVVGEALSLVRSAIPATVCLTPEVLPVGTVLADRTQVHQIVLNLCANARDAVAGKGEISVELRLVTPGPELPELSGRRCARLRVRDDGVGMPAATRARLFEPYMTTRAQAGGHGLGLAVVHGIVAAAGGSIQVQSEPGQGSTFEVYFPTVEQIATPRSPAPAFIGGHERILLVDDEPLVLSAHRRLLSTLGYQVTVASDASQALEKLRAAPGSFDLVISDQAMPKMSGLELAKTLLAEQPGTRVLLCTGFSDDLDEAGARALGLRGVLLKPLSRHAMDEAVRAALER